MLATVVSGGGSSVRTLEIIDFMTNDQFTEIINALTGIESGVDAVRDELKQVRELLEKTLQELAKGRRGEA